ncbi:ATP-binding cassette domain-containing protein [Mucilaginibacter sp. E4BP6]|uniref:ATP-binding cassette domain-containing protein n=1 Tax=Mucilaginibacter sp. E4BP6 TaxID=2723089 RepID=UPI0015CA904D|nr:ABC transporter ATP-binding protein [Mucilaginibacter sp. E4BP6]NYE65919.1 ABC-type bacteriocin/lantibiotic exporter with double-glycine peptidase domain [Mucilaginibacter sp. E4BP6]
MKYFIQLVLRILDHKEKVKFGLNIILDLLIGVLDIVFLGLLLIVINFYSTNQLPVTHFLQQSLFDKNSLVLISFFLGLYGIKNWLGYHISKSQNSFFYDVASRLSKQNMLDYLSEDYFKFINIDSSVYTRKISQQPIEFSNYILTNIQQIISQSILIFFTIVGILFYHPSLFISLFVLLMPPVILSGYYIKCRLKDVRTNSKLTSQLTLQYLKESLSGYIESNVYNKNIFFTDRYWRYQKQLNGYIATQQTLQGLPSRLIEVFAVLGFLILIAINKYFSGNHGVGLLDIGVFMAASYKIIPGVVKILNSTGQIKTYEFTLNDLQRDKEVAISAGILKSSISSIQFNKIGFSYRHNQVLNNFSLDLSSGDFVGITGPSGLGKTTIVNLLLGFLEQDSGTISINNVETNSSDRQLFWNRIAYSKQQSFFINDSILKNIILTDGGYDSSKLDHVLSFCGVDNILGQYPEGIEKLITENGKNISGGQKQRLMLARALYHDFDLLILDEPFSELDDIAEKTLLIKLRLLAQKGKMIIMITHNKSSLSFCNKLISLND